MAPAITADAIIAVVTTATILVALALAWQKPAAESPQEQIDNLATALQKGDASGALAIFDPQTPSFAEIKANIEALSALPNTSCNIAITHTSQSGDAIGFETDWTLQTYPQQNGPLLDRHDSVAISLRRIDNSWKIVAFSRPAVFAPPDPKIFRRIADLASNLNEKDQTDAVGAFDSGMKQYAEIDNDIDALVNQTDVLCAIDIVADHQTGDTHKLDLDWYLDLKSRTDGGPSAQRRERVQATLRQIRGKWKIIAIEPLSILSPAIGR
jgi:ketosteroid isomerase-like protein